MNSRDKSNSENNSKRRVKRSKSSSPSPSPSPSTQPVPLPLHDVIDLSNTLAQPSAVLTAQLPTIITTRTIDKEAVSSIFSSTAKASISKYGDIEDKRARKLDSARWIMDYILVEMFGIGEPGSLEPPGQEATTNVHNFLLVPLMLESLIVLGNFVLLDAFLYVLTFLPIRVVFSVLLLCVEVLKFLLGFVFRVFPLRLLLGDKAAVFLGPPWGRLRFHRTNLYDLLRGLLLLLGTAALRQLDMSKVYHFIRGQNVIKLYVLCSMMEIMDKLLSSFGQDAFDSLYWQTKLSPRSPRLAGFFLLVAGYVVLHACLYFLQVATLTVVVNSADTALITVLVLNNFSELRSFVFKKYEPNHLFQLSCADVTERFQIFLSLAMIFIVAINGPGAPRFFFVWTEESLCYKAGLIVAGEMAADAIKHAFINKFNGIHAAVYADFAAVIRMDILSNQKDQIILDHTYSVTRRLGLCQIPLGCMCLRYLHQAWLSQVAQGSFRAVASHTFAAYCAAAFLALVQVKILLGLGLHVYASAVQASEAPSPSPAPVTGTGTSTGAGAAAPDSAASADSSPARQVCGLCGGIDVNNVCVGGPHGRPQLAQHSPLSAYGAPEKVHDIYISSNSNNNSSSSSTRADLTQLSARKDFMRELAGIERYKVHKGRMI